MFAHIRTFGKACPAIRRLLLPVWVPFKYQLFQLRNMLTGHRPVVYPVNGTTVLLHPSGQIAELVWGADFEPVERDFIAHAVRPGAVVVNVGANIGLYSLLAARLAGSTGAVHAFEPSRESHDRLCLNISLNDLTTIQAVPQAVSAFDGQLVLRDDPDHPHLDGHRFCEPLAAGVLLPSGAEVIPCIRLDTYMAALPETYRRAVDLMIIDVEGGELEVLKGALATISASPALQILVETTVATAAVDALLQEQGFVACQWDCASRTLHPCPPVRGNMIYVRPALLTASGAGFGSETATSPTTQQSFTAPFLSLGGHS